MNSSNDLFQKPIAMTFAFVVCTYLADSLVGSFVWKFQLLALKEPLKGTFNEGYNSLLHKKIKGRSTSVQQDLESLTKTP